MLLTVKEACEILRISRSHLWQLTRSGKIKEVRIGKRGIRIPEAEIERFISEGLVEVQPPIGEGKENR